ncbi:hypothetical protein EDS67_26720 [candidate division KSB1 bacterium]|nr:MAG: hypothetical protein EDS67_26720 [candidate division KSB1 bacterium]MBC6946689.1 hypothetical protein [candidate division KSB1 bacterium]MCE7944911.1 hypothetical protein [Chlorobi bacterium CHB1]
MHPAAQQFLRIMTLIYSFKEQQYVDPAKDFFLAQAMARAILMAILALMSALPLAAATYTVTNDSGAGSLRQAILDANANPGADIIDATGVSGTITVNPANYFLVITDDVTINGPGQANLTISGDDASRIFWIQNGTIIIQDLTLADGYAKGGNGGGGGMGAGGAIFMHEGKQGANPTDVASGSINLTLINVTLKDNDAIGGNGGSGNVTGGGGMGGNGNSGGASGGVLGSAVGYEYGGSVTDATVSARGTNGGIAIFGSGGRSGSPDDAGFGGGGGGAIDGGGAFGRGGFGGGGLAFPGNGNNGDTGNDDGQGGFGGGNGTTTGGGMGAGGAIFVASGTLTMKSVTFQNNTATGGAGGNDGQGLGGALFIFDKADNGVTEHSVMLSHSQAGA